MMATINENQRNEPVCTFSVVDGVVVVVVSMAPVTCDSRATTVANATHKPNPTLAHKLFISLKTSRGCFQNVRFYQKSNRISVF